MTLVQLDNDTWVHLDEVAAVERVPLSPGSGNTPRTKVFLACRASTLIIEASLEQVMDALQPGWVPGRFSLELLDAMTGFRSRPGLGAEQAERLYRNAQEFIAAGGLLNPPEDTRTVAQKVRSRQVKDAIGHLRQAADLLYDAAMNNKAARVEVVSDRIASLAREQGLDV